MNASKKARTKFSSRNFMREFFLLLTDEERQQIANQVGTSKAYLMQVYGGYRQPSGELAEAVQDASCGIIPAWYLRPDLYARESLI